MVGMLDSGGANRSATEQGWPWTRCRSWLFWSPIGDPCCPRRRPLSLPIWHPHPSPLPAWLGHLAGKLQVCVKARSIAAA